MFPHIIPHISMWGSTSVTEIKKFSLSLWERDEKLWDINKLKDRVRALEFKPAA